MNKCFLWAFVLFFILTGCVPVPEDIRDVRELRQDHAAYLTDGASGENALPADVQTRLDQDYNTIYFSVWHQQVPFHALPDRVRQDVRKYVSRRGYGENKRLHPSSWIRTLQKNAFLDHFPNALSRGITTHNTNLRELPTSSPHFSSAKGDSSAWPFDNLQRSTVPSDTPVMICHYSADKSWVLVETSFTYGWIPAQDVALVDEAFVQTWESGHYAVIIRDRTAIWDPSGRFLVLANVGHIFPFIGIENDKMQIAVAVTADNGQAAIRKGLVSLDAAAAKPLRFNRVNAAKVANEMIGEPYGWGGLYGNRDCSAMTRDFFAVFGIWLPRHSEDQVREVGTLVNLSGLEPQEKEKIILEKGVPYLSLLWRKGHVMIYIGAKDGRALIFHNIWGIRTKDLLGHEGRKIIGQAVITTLEPGKELRDIDSANGSLLDRIAAMNILVPADGNVPAK